MFAVRVRKNLASVIFRLYASQDGRQKPSAENEEHKSHAMRQCGQKATKSRHRVAEADVVVTLALWPLSYKGICSRDPAGMYDTPPVAQLRMAREVSRN